MKRIFFLDVEKSMFPREQKHNTFRCCVEWIKLFFHHPGNVTAAAPSLSSTTESAATYHTALSYLVTMDRIFCNLFPLKKSVLCEHWLRVAAVISFHVIQLFHGLPTFPCQKWIPLPLWGKVNDCELNTGHEFRISQAHMWPIRGVGLLVGLMKATNGCREHK